MKTKIRMTVAYLVFAASPTADIPAYQVPKAPSHPVQIPLYYEEPDDWRRPNPERSEETVVWLT